MIIKKLKVQNFRRYENYTIDLDSPVVVIHADNAMGKSTILEALYFITNQRSPFTNETTELMMQGQDKPYFRIEVDIEDEGDEKKLALFQSNGSRQYLVDEHKTTRHKFQEGLGSTLFSPEQIELLMISPPRRRDFLDSLIHQVDKDHDENMKKMRKILRQRNAYLKRLSKRFYESGVVPREDRQINYWSEAFAHACSGVVDARASYIGKLNSDIQEVVYKPSIDISSVNDPSDRTAVEETHLEQLADALKKDLALGHTTVGAHRDDWDIMTDKNIRKFGSRGEKRMAIGQVLIDSQELYQEVNGTYPLLLLDDISSELDDDNTSKILGEKFLDRQQTIITTIKLEDIPDEVQKKALIVDLND